MSERPDWAITPEELRELLAARAITLVDVREPEEHAESRIEGCVLIPLGELEERAPAELRREAEIVVYCAHGVRSVQGLMTLRMLGFPNTRSLEGGIAAWEELTSS